MMINNITLLTICVLVITGCSKSISVSALNGNAKDLYNEAEKLNEEGKKAESAKIILMLEDLHPKDQDLSNLKEKVFEDLCEDLGHEPDSQTLEQAIEERMEDDGNSS